MRLADLDGIKNPMILRPYWLSRFFPHGKDSDSSDTVANASQLIASNGIPHRTANRFSVPIAPNMFSTARQVQQRRRQQQLVMKSAGIPQPNWWQAWWRASHEVLFPFSVTQPYRDAWGSPRPRLSRFDVPCHNINQPASIAFGKLSLRFYFLASRTIRFIRPSRELSHPGDAHGIWSFAVLFLSTEQLLFPEPLPTCRWWPVTLDSFSSRNWPLNLAYVTIKGWRNGQSWTYSSGYWVSLCRQSAPWWDIRNHHRSILPWTWPLSGSTDALNRTFVQAYSWFRTISPRDTASSPNPLLGFRLVALMFCSLNQRCQIHPAHCLPFSVLMRQMPGRSLGFFTRWTCALSEVSHRP